MTVSIFKTLATLPSGEIDSDLTPQEAGAYLGNHYNVDGEKDRNTRHAVRDELFHDGGVLHMNGWIDKLFADPEVRKKRKALVPIARFNNALKRVVNEMSTVYSEPAKRMVAETEQPAPQPNEDGTVPIQATPNNDRYQAVLDAVRMDERMDEVSRLLNLHRAMLVGFRVRVRPDGTREPVLDIATPANVRAVVHPNDPSMVIGWMIRSSYKTARLAADTPFWTLWTDHESVQLRADLSVIGGSHKEHNLGVCPWVPVTLGPAGPGFWPGNEGEDLIAGHLAIWLQNTLLIKESKSATKQTVIQGDGTATSRGQSMDSEMPNELADGQSATTVDMSMDLSMFRDTADHVLSHLAQNYGMSPALISHQGVQSAEARELMRMPLKEIRRKQQVPLRRFEYELALVMAAVLAADYQDLAFLCIGWRIEFGESETPLNPIAEHELFEKRRAAGLDSTVEFMRRSRPGLTIDGALAAIDVNVGYELLRNLKMRPLQAISGSLGANTPDGKPADNRVKQPANENEPDDDLTALAKEILDAAK